jgi:hypothetical protein
MPSRLIEKQHGVGARRDGGGYFGEVERHPFGVAARQHQVGALAFSRADRTVDIGRCRALILGGRRPGAAFGPPPGNAVLLTDPAFVLPPQLYGRAARECRFNRCQLGWEVFLKTSMAPASCAWCRGRAVSFL